MKFRYFIIILILIMILLCIVLFTPDRKSIQNTFIQLSKQHLVIDPETQDPDYALHHPIAVQLDQGGNVYLLDSKNDRVKIFDKNMKFIRSLGSRGQGPDEMIEPTDMDLDKEGNIYIADPENSRIVIIDSSGQAAKNISLRGLKFLLDLNIAVDSEGLIYISTAESLITVLNISGQIINSFGEIYEHKRSGVNYNINVVHLDVDSENNLWVAYEHYIPEIRKYDNNGKLLFRKEITGPHIDEIRKKQMNIPLTGPFTLYGNFSDIKCLSNGNVLASTRNVLFELSPNGEVRQRFELSLKKDDFKNIDDSEEIGSFNLAYNEEENILWIVNWWYDMVFKYPITFD